MHNKTAGWHWHILSPYNCMTYSPKFMEIWSRGKVLDFLQERLAVQISVYFILLLVKLGKLVWKKDGNTHMAIEYFVFHILNYGLKNNNFGIFSRLGHRRMSKGKFASCENCCKTRCYLHGVL